MRGPRSRHLDDGTLLTHPPSLRMRSHQLGNRLPALTSAFAALLLGLAAAPAQDALPTRLGQPPSATSQSPRELKKLSLEELVDVEITSASRRPGLLSQAASAIDVVTAETIRRSGVTSLPDALRLAAGVQVAQIDGHSWAISARGFNLGTANKLQVLMDGRSLYTPLYSGVFWDVQQTFLPDLEQIEVIRGPGATLWGANAVNGVINIRSKNAKDTQGFLVDTAGGEELGYAGVRYGGKIGSNTFYRAWVMHTRRDELSLADGSGAGDATDFTKGGFRIDSTVGVDDALTLQGDGYGGSFGQHNAGDISVDGGNVLARWTHELAADSNLTVQTYYDRTHRLIPALFEEERNTFDLELEGRRVFNRHDFVYGANYRLSADEIGNLGPQFAFLPDDRTVHLVSGYLQDEWHVVPRRFSLGLGSKFEWNSFSGFELQPSGRFIWTPSNTQSLWGAISRAVRTPTRIDQDIFAPNPSTGSAFSFVGNRGFRSEVVVAYELGYRVEPTPRLAFDLATYYNEYDNLRSIEPRGGPGTPLRFDNKIEGSSYGATLSTHWRVTDGWRLDGNFSALHLDLHGAPGSLDPAKGRANGNDPDFFFTVRSSLDLPWHLQFDTVVRYVSDLPQPATPAYTALDLRLAWKPRPNFEVALVGRNLLDPQHPEFASATAVTREVDRSVFATLKWTY